MFGLTLEEKIALAIWAVVGAITGAITGYVVFAIGAGAEGAIKFSRWFGYLPREYKYFSFSDLNGVWWGISGAFTFAAAAFASFIARRPPPSNSQRGM